MEVEINDTCTACGLCVEICPKVFEMGPDIVRTTTQTVPPELRELVQQAADECPVSAIILH